MHIVAHCVFSDLCSGINQVLLNYQMVFNIQWNVLCCCGVGCCDAYESDDFGQVGGLEEGYWGAEWVRHLGQCLVQMFFRIGSCPIVCASEKVEASLQ